MADTAHLRNGRDHSATGRNAVYSGRRTTRRLLPDLLRTRRSDSVSDNIFAVATLKGPIICSKGDGLSVGSRHPAMNVYNRICTRFWLHVPTPVVARCDADVPAPS